MQKLIAQVSTFTFLAQSLVSKAFAQNDGLLDVPPVPDLNEQTDIEVIIVNIIEIILDVILIIAVLFVIVAGVRLIVSGGEEGEKDKAKKTIIYVIVGIIVILFARAVVVFVADQISNAGA